MDFPAYKMPPPPILTPFHPDSMGMMLAAELFSGTISTMGQAISAAWPANNKAYYYPFRLTDHATAVQLLFMVGGTSSGNIDVGIYDAECRLIISAGTTAMSATIDTVQEINITDTPLAPGEYFLGVACSTTGGTGFRAVGNDELAFGVCPVYEQATALPLPDPAVPVLCTDTAVSIWVCGIQFVPTF